MDEIEVHDPSEVAKAFKIATCLAAEIEWINDDYWRPVTPEARWRRVRKWVEQNLKAGQP